MVFEEFCQNLAEFLTPHITRFGATCVCLGGNVAKYRDNFLVSKLNIPSVDVRQSVLYEDASILGGVAAVSCLSSQSTPNSSFRLTKQAILPIYKPQSPTDAPYDIYPSFYCGENKIFDGYDSLAERILESKRENVIFDGYVGVKFESLREEIDARLKLKKKKVLWREISSALKSPNEIDALIKPCGMDNNDPLFGKRCMLELKEFFDEEKISFLSQMNNYDETETR
jgi:hypothetical protein